MDYFENSERPIDEQNEKYDKCNVSIIDDEKRIGRYMAWKLIEGYQEPIMELPEECLEMIRTLFGLLIKARSLGFSSAKGMGSRATWRICMMVGCLRIETHDEQTCKIGVCRIHNIADHRLID